jgi:hypothetical protein
VFKARILRTDSELRDGLENDGVTVGLETEKIKMREDAKGDAVE